MNSIQDILVALHTPQGDSAARELSVDWATRTGAAVEGLAKFLLGSVNGSILDASTVPVFVFH